MSELPAVRDQYELEECEWQQLAEFEAIIRPICALAIKCQVDKKANIGSAWLRVVDANFRVFKNIYRVVDIKFEEGDLDPPLPGDDPVGWDASVRFEDLPKRKMTTDPNQYFEAEGSGRNIGMMTEMSQKLVDRLKNEFDRYLNEPHQDSLLAMACDPLMATVGKDLLTAFSTKQKAIWTKAFSLLKDALRKEAEDDPSLNVVLPHFSDSPEHVSENDASDAESDDLADYCRRQKKANRVHEQLSAVDVLPSDAVDMALSAWAELQIDWPRELAKQGIVAGHPLFNAAKISQKNAMYLVDVFDSMRWMKDHAEEHRLVSRVAARNLSKPAANSFQERVFSLCKRMDTSLRGRMGSAKFEMLMLLSWNARWISERGLISMQELRDSIHSSVDSERYAKIMVEFFDTANPSSSDMLDMAQELIVEAKTFTAVKNSKRQCRNDDVIIINA